MGRRIGGMGVLFLVFLGPEASADTGLQNVFDDVITSTDDPLASVCLAAGIDPADEGRFRLLMEEVDAYRRPLLDAYDDPDPAWMAPAQGEIFAGVAERVITPERGCPLAGYGDRIKTIPFLYQPFVDPFYYSKLYQPSRGVHDELRAKAIVLDNGTRRVALVGVDSVGMTQLIFVDVVSRIEHLGIGRSDLIMGGSHTHGGHGDVADQFLWWLATTDLFDRRIYDPLIESLVDLIEDAVADLALARVGVGASPAAEGLIRNRRGDQTLDPELAVIRVDDLNGDPRALLFNMTVHGTMMGGSNLKFTGDCMGYAQRHLEDRLNATAIFLNGCEGDVSPTPQGGSDDWERADLWGAAAADAVQEVYDAIETRTAVDLAGAHVMVDLPAPSLRPGFFLDPPTPGNVVIPLSGLVEQERTNFTAVRIADAAFVSMPGEAITQIGLDVKAHGESIGFPATYVVGLSNGHLGYMTTEEEYWQGGYESGATFFGPATGDLMVRSASQALDLLNGAGDRVD